MHTWYYRLNGLFTVSTSVLAVMCVLASLTEVMHKKTPQLDVSVHSVDGMGVERRNDRAWLTLDISADLRSVFNWNTKQIYVYVTADFQTKRNHLSRVTLYDKIIQNSRDASIEEPHARIPWPMALTDQGTNFRGLPYNLTLAWQSVPFSGLLLSGSETFTGFRLPTEYTNARNARW